MRLEDEDTGYNLQLVPGTYGMNVRSACTIVIIAGKNRQKNTDTSSKYFYFYFRKVPWKGGQGDDPGGQDH